MGLLMTQVATTGNEGIFYALAWTSLLPLLVVRGSFMHWHGLACCQVATTGIWYSEGIFH